MENYRRVFPAQAPSGDTYAETKSGVGTGKVDGMALSYGYLRYSAGTVTFKAAWTHDTRQLAFFGNGGTMNIGISPNKEGVLDEEDVKALKGFKVLKDAFFSCPVKNDGKFNFVQTKDENGVKRLYLTCDRNIAGERYLVDEELIKLVRNATTLSGETDTAKWMTGAEKERK